MKAACFILTTIIVVAMMAVSLMVKFATEISYEERRRATFDGHVHSFSGSMGVIALNENTSETFQLAEKYPFLAAIFRNTSSTWSFSCFGCIILAKWVITGAHCRKPGSMHRALIYHDYIKNSTKSLPIYYWKIHKEFKVNGSTVKHDLAIGKLDSGLEGSLRSAMIDNNQMMSPVVNACVWKSLSTMDKVTYLTNDFDVFEVKIAAKADCFEVYGVQVDDSLICVDVSSHGDCFTHEFGPLFHGDKLLGVLAVKPKDCDIKYAIFTNISFYTEWIIRTTRSRGFL